MKTLSQSCAAVLMGVMLVLPALGTAEDKAPMPQTKGMAGMDPAQHDQKAAEPYKDCKLNAEAAAKQAKNPMPQTKGMAGMDPKAHEMDCPEATIKAEDKAKHVHKAPGG